MRKIGDVMHFAGGACNTSRVSVETYDDPGSMHHGDTVLSIRQDEDHVILDIETIKAILAWYETGD